MEPDPSPKASTSSKSGIGIPFLLSFRSRNTASETGRSENESASSQSDMLSDIRGAIEQLLQPKLPVAEQRMRMQFLIECLMREPAELEPLLDPPIATPLVSSLIVLCSRLLRETFAYELRVLSCELLTSTLRYADVSTQSVSSEVWKESSSATGWQAVMPSRALSMLDRAMLYRLIVNLHRREDWILPKIFEEPSQAFHTLSRQLAALQVLTRDGRDILAFKGIFNVMTKWLRYSWGALLMFRRHEMSGMYTLSEHCTYTLFDMFTSICKFNASRLEKEHMKQYLICLCELVLNPRIPTLARSKHSRHPSSSSSSSEATTTVAAASLAATSNSSTAIATTTATTATATSSSSGYKYYGMEDVSTYFDTPSLYPIDGQPENERQTEKSGVYIGIQDSEFPFIKHEDITGFAKSLDSIICYTFVPPECLSECVHSLCRLIGLPIAQTEEQMLVSRLSLHGVDIQSDFRLVLNNLVCSHIVHLMFRHLYEILCTRRNGNRSVRVGALLFIHATMIWNVAQRMEQGGHVKTSPLISQALFESMIRGAISQSDDVLDLICLFLIEDYLPERQLCADASLFENVPVRVRQAPQPLCTLYDDAISTSWGILADLVPLMNRHLSRRRRGIKMMNMSSFVLHTLVGLLCSRLEQPLISLPIISNSFWGLAFLLPDHVLLSMIKANENQHIYLPSTPDWLDNLIQLCDTFYPKSGLDASGMHALMSRTSRLYAVKLVVDVYGFVQDLPLLRDPMIQHVVVPLASRAAQKETDIEIGVPIRRMVRHAMVTAVCTPTINGCKPFYDLLRCLVDNVFKANLTNAENLEKPQAMAQHSRQRSVGPHNVDDIRDARLRTTRATRSILDLITLFMQMAFGISDASTMAPELDTSTSEVQDRLRECSLAVFRELLRLIQANAPFSSVSEDSNSSSTRVPVSLRLMILRWILRLRADTQHRIYFQNHEEDFTKSLVQTLSRNEDPRDQQDRGRSGPHSSTLSHATSQPSVDETQESNAAPPEVPSSEFPEASWSSCIWQVSQIGVHGSRIAEHAEDNKSDTVPMLFPTSEYLEAMLNILQSESDWEVLSYIISHLPSQLNNKHLFCGVKATTKICELRDWLCPLLLENKPLPNLVLPGDLRRTDLTAVLYATLKVLMAYHCLFTRAQQDELVEAFAAGLSHSQTVAQPCVRALVVAGYELSKSFTRQLTNILVKLSTIMSSIQMSVHILELLAEVSSVQALYANFTEADYRRVFGIALQYIQFHESKAASDTREDLRSSPAKFALSQYVLLLAYNNISQWFMTLKLSERPKHASYITQGLMLANEGRESPSDQTIVCLDFLARFTYSNALPKPSRSILHRLLAQKNDVAPPSRGSTWLLGKGLISIRPLARSGTFEATVRRPSGTVAFVCRLENMVSDGRTAEERTADILAAALERWKSEGSINKPVIEAPNESESAEAAICMPDTPSDTALSKRTEDDRLQTSRMTDVEPIFMALQFSGYPDQSNETPPILLPDDPMTERLLRAMDLTPVYDFHKIGLLYVGYKQTTENEILSNTHGSMAYMLFLSRLGDLVPLLGQEDVYTGGLDRQSNEHGKYAYVWRDYSKQIVFHTSTLMPNHPEDPNRSHKKALIGNDWVHIVFNDSGLPYEFGTIPSQFNFVNIVISPHSTVREGVDYSVTDETYFHVTLQLRPGLPDFSPAGEGCLVSFATLPRFVRNLAMQSDIMSQIYLDTAESMVPFSNNRVTRLHLVERFRQQFMARNPEIFASASEKSGYDFTELLIK